MGAALHLAHVHETPVRKKRRKGGGGDDGNDGPFLIVPRDACEACARHWHHKCWGANVLDEQRPNCPCPCDDPADPTGERMRRAAWSDLAQHDPVELGLAVQRLRLREAGAAFICGWTNDESGLRSVR
ncbi:hypothetical protein [Kitasatospora camelliae]|uniref:Uncharacterized protein n=1 Tax=Kitasatospora camelliae TaxID=3156397 RepID=A0AAU8K4E2_9ACTN